MADIMKDLEGIIREVAKERSEKSFDEFKEMQAQYWSLHEQIAKKTFSSHWEQVEAIRRLSLFGLALHAKGEEYKAINAARCN